MSSAFPSDTAGAAQPLILHATCAAWQGRAVLIGGASGSGKSALGLALLGWGCDLVADDRTLLGVEGGALTARCPPRLQGLIEARGVGLLAARAVPEARVALAVTLDSIETERLPPRRSISLLGIEIPFLHKVETAHFAAAILQYLKAGRSD
ncbi:HPr kinase/phosphatase C-terminal domain-containing protein [Pseudoroseicyclus aestuarii]|uniref:HPr kinase/phosphorylase n=1 Tax=Pseudoroseicyclus aestuarii TaxID=1795041 RepID=UPI000DA20DDB